MLKYIYVSIMSLGVLVGISAKPDPNATKLLKKVEQYYKSLQSIEIPFTIEMKAAEQKPTIQKGNYIGMGNAYKIILPDQEIYSDGTTQWTYLKTQKEIQITEAVATESQLTPAMLSEMYKNKKYDFRMEAPVTESGVKLQVIDFKPADKNQSTFKIKLFINSLTLEIVKVQFFEKNGDRSLIQFKKAIKHSMVKNADFQLDTKKYPGVHIEDLREE
ncbi:MAG: outer membrane lipoprotein carrier protein LolA [Bacteroidota bacterium]|nr:outer membrane lipoprotein carrier protein LolA [Bacteroidota bacterium]